MPTRKLPGGGRREGSPQLITSLRVFGCGRCMWKSTCVCDYFSMRLHGCLYIVFDFFIHKGNMELCLVSHIALTAYFYFIYFLIFDVQFFFFSPGQSFFPAAFVVLNSNFIPNPTISVVSAPHDVWHVFPLLVAFFPHEISSITVGVPAQIPCATGGSRSPRAERNKRDRVAAAAEDDGRRPPARGPRCAESVLSDPVTVMSGPTAAIQRKMFVANVIFFKRRPHADFLNSVFEWNSCIPLHAFDPFFY